MGQLVERIDSRLTDLRTELAQIAAQALVRTTALQAEETQLTRMRALVTPELEAAVVGLQKLGFLRNL